MNKLMIALINFYQKRISPNANPRCRYKPSCSQYAKEAFMKFNFFYAFFLMVFRILRCNPLFKGGYDPVPLTRVEKNIKNMFPKNL